MTSLQSERLSRLAVFGLVATFLWLSTLVAGSLVDLPYTARVLAAMPMLVATGAEVGARYIIGES